MADPNEAGNYAVYRGHAYKAYTEPGATWVDLACEPGDPVPEGAEPDPVEPERVYRVAVDQLEQWFSTRWTFSWHGEPFEAVGSRDGRITGWYAGYDQAFADAHCKRTGMYEYLGTFPLGEVTDLTEHRTDLLAKWKEKHGR